VEKWETSVEQRPTNYERWMERETRKQEKNKNRNRKHLKMKKREGTNAWLAARFEDTNKAPTLPDTPRKTLNGTNKMRKWEEL